MKYSAKRASRFSKRDAQKIGPILNRLARKGKSSARDILEEAQSKDSPLHEFFEWDDTAAAEKYRLEQARYMARSIVVIVEHEDTGEPKELRAFPCVTVETANPGRTSHYVSLTMVKGDQKLLADVVRQAKSELRAFRNKYEAYAENFRGLFEEIDRLLEE